jgi:hypothetical protein
MADHVIEIPAIKLARVTVSVKGETPLITNRFGENARKLIEDKQQKKARGAREARVPEEEFKDAMHLISGEHGKPGAVYGFPASGIKKALVVAGGRFADEKMTHLRGIINIMADFIEIKGPPPTMRSDTIRLRNGVSSIAYRPQFMPWAMDIPVVYNADLIGEAQIFNLFQIAGFSVGIGCWRPESNGTNGQFTLFAEDQLSKAS